MLKLLLKRGVGLLAGTATGAIMMWLWGVSAYIQPLLEGRHNFLIPPTVGMWIIGMLACGYSLLIAVIACPIWPCMAKAGLRGAWSAAALGFLAADLTMFGTMREGATPAWVVGIGLVGALGGFVAWRVGVYPLTNSKGGQGHQAAR